MKDGYGEKVHNEVVRTKMEIVEHNASAGYVTVELSRTLRKNEKPQWRKKRI
ncbi:hypothetical protein N665_0172s0061 [Sinapis alba]|nr:hypothetical protein N665_0172s0061 [Sinapis alba]